MLGEIFIIDKHKYESQHGAGNIFLGAVEIGEKLTDNVSKAVIAYELFNGVVSVGFKSAGKSNGNRGKHHNKSKYHA